MHHDIKSVVGFECQGSHRIAGDQTTNIITLENISLYVVGSITSHFYRDIVLTHGVQMGGWAAGKVCPGCISEIVRCRKLILGRDIG